jgi:hypothetical protein
MGAYRIPGPLGSIHSCEPVDTGTLALVAAPPPGPVGAGAGSPERAAPGIRGAASPTQPTLSLYDRGPAVSDLQTRLNQDDAAAALKVDGIFGPKTHAAVLAYQRRYRLAVDGIVGPQTWRQLLLMPQRRTGGASAAPPVPPAPPPAARPQPKQPDGAPSKERRFIEIRWVESEAYCGGPATLTGSTLNYTDGSQEQAQVLIASNSAIIASVALAISGDAFSQDVPVKDWLPRRIGSDFEEARDQNATAAGKKTPKPLSMKFIPTLQLAECTIGIAHFHMLVKNYECQIQGNITYVPGFMAWLIQLGSTVNTPPPAWARALLPSRVLNMMRRTPGGQTGVDWGPSDPNSFSGSDWRFAKDDVSSPSGMVYWDGKAWQNVPDSWSDPNNVKLYGIGIWREAAANKAQFGNAWPENIPSWSPSQQAVASRTLPGWSAKCKSAWSNKFDLRRDGCASSKDACCRYSVTASVSFTAVATRQEHTIVLAVNNGRSNAGAWSLGDTRPGLAPHEFGHHLGAPDEYPGGVGIDTTVNTDGATQGIDTSSLMGSVPDSSVPPIKARHLNIISQQLSAMIQAEKGVSWKFKTVAHR